MTFEAYRRRTALAVLAAAVLAGGCRGEEISHYRVAKQAPPPAAFADDAGSAPAAPVRAGGPTSQPAALEVPPPPRPSGGAALRWTLPKGWTESLSGGMRYATLKPPVDGRVDVSVVVLPGPAGGELANVNRWRGQIGLPPVDEAALAAARKTIRSKAGAVAVYDFANDGAARARFVAGLAAADGNTWFVKMAGDAGPVAAARRDFIHLLESLRFEADAN